MYSLNSAKNKKGAGREMNSIAAQTKILTTSEIIALYSLVIGIVGGFLNALPRELLGFSPTALGWVIPVLACFSISLSRLNQNTFPIFIWLPWILYTTVCYLNNSAPNAFQRHIMLHAAIIIAVAFSSFQPSNYFYERFSKYIDYYFWLVFTIGMATAGLLSGSIADSTGFAAGAITASLLAVWYSGKYSIDEKSGLYYWIALCLVPFLCNTRTGMIAVALTMPLTFGPLSLKKRLIVTLIIIFMGALAFQTERIQSKMFISGHGDYSDAFNGMLDLMTGTGDSEDGVKDFSTNGRKSIALALKDGLNKNYWTGNGSNSSEAISMDLSGVSHPHNDWLRIQYEYGMLGIIIFIGTILGQIYHASKRLKYLPRKYMPVFCIGIGSFVPMGLFMTSDNILLYIAWFGNLQFAAIGVFYGLVERLKVRA